MRNDPIRATGEAALIAIPSTAFEAWDPAAGGWGLPSPSNWPAETQTHLMALHVAWRLMHESPDGVGMGVNHLLEDGADAAEDALRSMHAAAYFGRLQRVLDAASARFMVVGLQMAEEVEANSPML